MTIKFKPKTKNAVIFKDLNIGNTFIYRNNPYIKKDHYLNDNTNATNLLTGKTVIFLSHTDVTPTNFVIIEK